MTDIWSTWEDLGGKLSSSLDPVAVSWKSGRLDVFVVGTDNNVYHIFYEGKWSNADHPSIWENLGAPPGGVVGRPAVTTWGINRLDIFVRSRENNTIYQKSFLVIW